MTLVFVSMFLVIFIGLSGLVTRSYHESIVQSHNELAFQIAENGLNFARWRLAHAPDDLSDETKVITDQFAGDLGSFTLAFDPPPAGESTVTITSTGQTVGGTGGTVVLRARYGQQSLARFSSITNKDVWFGGAISGQLHANGGVRMDGTTESLVSSAKATYECQPYHGCSSPSETKPGVWGSGTIQSLWDFPVAPVDFNALTLSLLDMKTAAQAAGTYYGPSGSRGYQIVFNTDNTYTMLSGAPDHGIST